jgi:hypothetical protein
MIRKFLAVSALAFAGCAAAAGDGADWRLGAHVEVLQSTWQRSEKVVALGAAPVLRIERTDSAVAPYFEGAIGLHLLSQVEANQALAGTRLQRGDQIGIGFRFGERRRHDIGLRLQYFSDGGVARPEPGASFGLLRYQYQLD